MEGRSGGVGGWTEEVSLFPTVLSPLPCIKEQLLIWLFQILVTNENVFIYFTDL